MGIPISHSRIQPAAPRSFFFNCSFMMLSLQSEPTVETQALLTLRIKSAAAELPGTCSSCRHAP